MAIKYLKGKHITCLAKDDQGNVTEDTILYVAEYPYDARREYIENRCSLAAALPPTQ